jgi:HAD superfamily hydrolase (TIGR01509 family)
MTSSLQAVLFDMDGTLIDSEHYWMAAEVELAATTGAIWTEQDGLSLIGMSLYDSTRLLKQKLGLQLEGQEIIDRLTESVVSQLRGAIPWRPGAVELLRLLRERGVKTALVTMSMRRMALAVAESVGFDAFDVVLGGDDVTMGKPDPEPYLKAASLLGVDIAHCVAFEDSISGLHSAEASGAVAIGIPNLVTLPPKPDRIIWPTLVSLSVEDLDAIVRETRAK